MFVSFILVSNFVKLSNFPNTVLVCISCLVSVGGVVEFYHYVFTHTHLSITPLYFLNFLFPFENFIDIYFLLLIIIKIFLPNFHARFDYLLLLFNIVITMP